MKLLTEVTLGDRKFEVSTVLLPVEFRRPGRPYETLIFEVHEGERDHAVTHPVSYATWEEANKGHAQMVQDLQEGRIELGEEDEE